MTVIVLTIDEATPTLNRMLGQHWGTKHKLRNRWAWLVRRARLRTDFTGAPWPRARVTIERTGGRLVDPDNYAAGTKFLTDQLVREGLIVDDSPKHIETVLKQIVHKTLRQTRVTIEALP